MPLVEPIRPFGTAYPSAYPRNIYGETPHTPYFGTVDATPLWLVLLGATFDWTGDRALIDRLWPNVLRALDWIDRYGDRDGDGFVEYERRTDRGLLNQGWKDSSDAIRDRRGRLVHTPIALAEVQGYVFDAKRRIAGLARIRGDGALAGRLEAEAEQLRDRFEQAFWVDDLGFYAMALDGDKRPADAIASNAGQCLWTGIVSPERAGRVVERLMAPDMFTGWGIRTLRRSRMVASRRLVLKPATCKCSISQCFPETVARTLPDRIYRGKIRPGDQ